MKTTTKKTSRKKSKRRRGGKKKRRATLPGLEEEIGEAVIDRELDAPDDAGGDEPPPPPPSDPSKGGCVDLGTSSTEETAELVQTLYGMASGGELKLEKGEKDGRLPQEEAKLYARCVEKVVGDEELLTPKRALLVLLVGLGGRVFMAVKAKRDAAAAAAAAAGEPGQEQAA